MSVKGKNKNWGPAIGYYDLAIAVDPSSGIPYNQLAIISKTEGDHARALYHLYRAQCAFEPPATAFANLELEFKKIREASERGCEEAETCGPSDDPLATLQRVLPLLHARYFGSMEFPEYMESETKMLESLIVGLTKHMLETSFVNRMVLSNIAADFTAGDRWQGNMVGSDFEAKSSLQFLQMRLSSLRTSSHLDVSRLSMSGRSADF